MLEVHNSYLRVPSEDKELIKILGTYLMHYEKVKGGEQNEIALYHMNPSGDMIIPPGFNKFIPDQVARKYLVEEDIPRDLEVDYNAIAHDFGEKVILRDDQITAIRKMFMVRAGIIQLATGSGKTEIMTGFLKCFEQVLGYIPTTIILEPTIKLVSATVERLNKYGVDAKPYSENRGVIEGIIVTHPQSLNNDLKKNPSLIQDVKIFLSDEGHHLQADTWNCLLDFMTKVEFRLAVSASVIDSGKIPVVTLSTLDLTELSVLGATGDILMNVPPSFYIERGILATPILFRISNNADEFIENDEDWHKIRKGRLESPARTLKISKICSFLANVKYKSLVLVGTKEHAYKIMGVINNLGLGDVCRCTFGGNTYYKWDTEKDKPVKCKDEDTFSEFEKGNLKIFIGTSHIYEGADIPNLDVVILAGIGKKLRRVIQGVGRAIRRSKTGKYAYIIDFTDTYDKILNRHSLERLEMCRDVIGVSTDNIYTSVSFETFKSVFYNLENLN